MHQRSLFSLSTVFRRHTLLPSPKPTSFFLLKSTPPLRTPPPTSNPTHFTHPSTSISCFRSYSSNGSAPGFDKNKIVDEINMKFAEAREEIEAAMESKETVYFNEEAECARAAVKDVLDLFNGLLGKLEVQEKEALMRSMGLKIEQLKAELKQLEDD